MTSAPSPRVIHLLTTCFALLVGLFGLFTAVETVRIVALTYSPVLSWDQWQIIHTLIRSHGHPTLGDFWAQHNEHRIPTVRFFSLLDLFFFGGRNVSLYIEIFFLQLCHLVLFCTVVFRSSRMSWPSRVTLAGFFTYCFFSPLQMENFDWGFQIGFILTNFAASLAFAAFAWCPEQMASSSRGSKLALAICLLAALVAEGSNSHGLITWPVLIFLAVALHFPQRVCWTLSVVAAVAIALYLIGFDPQCPPGSYGRALSHPGELLKFSLTYLGNSWSEGLPHQSAWPTAAESIALLSIVATIVLAIRCLRHRSICSPLQMFLLGNLLFGIGTVAMTAVGRHRFGLAMAASSRYQTPALVYWMCCAALLAVSFPQGTKLRLLAAQVSLLILMLSGASRWADIAHEAAERQYRLEQAWNAAVQDKFADPAAASLFYDLKMTESFVHYMRKRGWGPHGVIRSFAVRQAEHPATLNGYHVLVGICTGQIEGAVRSGLRSAVVNGWATPLRGYHSSARIVFASRSGEIVPSGIANVAQPDVVPTITSPDHSGPRWSANLVFPDNGDYRAFLLGQDPQTACAIDNVVRAKRLPPF